MDIGNSIEFNKENIRWMRDERGLPGCFLKIKVPSVSTILGLIPDPSWDEFIAKVGKERADIILQGAGNRGSATHVFLENFITNYSKSKDVSEALHFTQTESPKILMKDNIPSDKIDEGRNLFYKFYYSDYPNVYTDMLAMELGLFSPSLYYRGKLDILYKDKMFGLSLTDFKSSNGKIKKGSVKEYKYFLQLGAYSNCITEMYKEKKLTVSRASILCLDKQSDVLQEIALSGKELKKYEEEFKELVVQYHIQNKQEYLLN